MPPDPPDQPQIAPELVGVGEQTRRRLAGLHFRAKRRRPSGERPPLPIELRRSGVIWLIVAAVVAATWASLFMFPTTTLWWEARDQGVLDWLVELRTSSRTTVAEAVHALGSPWTWRLLRWGTLLILIVTKRWRHLAAVAVAFLAVDGIATWINSAVARPRPFVPIIGDWEGYSHPSIPVAALAVTLAVQARTLVGPGRKRRIWMGVSGGLIGALVVARVYLGADHLTDAVMGALFGLGVGVVAVAAFAPESVFPVRYRRGKTAHLDVSGERGDAIRTAIGDQLGIEVLSVVPVGLEASGGSTPLRLDCAGVEECGIFAKIYARNHLRADRWYKLGRTLRYGSLEDEVSFSSVRRLVEYEDHMLRLLLAAGIPAPEPLGVVEITPEREYLVVTEFLDEGEEISEVPIDDDIIDQLLLSIRKMWDAGLAHRDIKPANIMVQRGKVRFVDVAFTTLRPTPWRQAVDLANAMLVLSLGAEPATVYDRALQLFAPEDIAEAFAATHGITIPGQLRTDMRDHERRTGVDLRAAFRDLAPPAQIISVQRWTRRRIVMALGAAAALSIAVSIFLDTVRARGFL